MNNRKVFLRLFLCLSFGWGALTFGYAQTVSKTFSNAPLKTVLKEVESQTGLSVVYKTDEVDVNRKVNASFQNASLEDVMAQILDKGLTWSIQEKMIVISKQPQEQVQPAGKGLNVRGVIVDETGIPVIGASVLVRGSSNGSITDIGYRSIGRSGGCRIWYGEEGELVGFRSADFVQGDRAPHQRQYGVCPARAYPQLQCVVQRRCD